MSNIDYSNQSTDPIVIDLLGWLADVTVGNVDAAIGIGIECSAPSVSSRSTETVCCDSIQNASGCLEFLGYHFNIFFQNVGINCASE